MKIDAISDTHGFHRDPFFDELKESDADMLIHAGDLSMIGELDVLMDVNQWLGELPHQYKIIIGGNHDRTLGGKDMLAYKLFTNATYLENSKVEFEGKIFWGSPWTPWKHEYIANYFAFGKMRNSISWKIPKNTDVAITHCPPFGYGDLLAEGSSEPNTNIGDKKLLEKLLEIKPTYNICGHIHEGYGIVKDKGITFINASSVNERYNLVNKPVRIEL